MSLALQVAGLFILVASAEMLNGIARTLFLNKRVGAAGAKRLHGFFDVAVGRFVVKARWETILGDFDVRRGNPPGVGLVALAFCPLLAMRVARLLGRPAG